ncbi:hypothetical protein ABE137_12760 [Brevibacillus laterosporus]|uniref:hypothetical protein n=1 Tax=Brevibacillus laterosporus TaxID=1465 RepID=UPI003D24A8D1
MANLRVWGTTNIRGNVTITTGVNDKLTVDVDGIGYTIILSGKAYKTVRELHKSEFVDELNNAFKSKGIPVEVKLGGALNDQGKVNYVVFIHKNSAGSEKIENFGGNMKSLIFA